MEDLGQAVKTMKENGNPMFTGASEAFAVFSWLFIWCA